MWTDTETNDMYDDWERVFVIYKRIRGQHVICRTILRRQVITSYGDSRLVSPKVYDYALDDFEMIKKSSNLRASINTNYNGGGGHTFI